MIHIIVTGHITENKKCANDLEAYLYLVSIKDRHDEAIRNIARSVKRPERYHYNIDHAKDRQKYIDSSLIYQKEIRPLTAAFPLKVEILDIDKFYKDDDLI